MPTREYAICENKRWIDVINPSSGEIDRLSGEFKLNELIVRDSMEPKHLPKYDLLDDVNFLTPIIFVVNAPIYCRFYTARVTNIEMIFVV